MGRQPKYLDTQKGKGKRWGLKLHFVDCKRRPFLEAREGAGLTKNPSFAMVARLATVGIVLEGEGSDPFSGCGSFSRNAV